MKYLLTLGNDQEKKLHSYPFYICKKSFEKFYFSGVESKNNFVSKG